MRIESVSKGKVAKIVAGLTCCTSSGRDAVDKGARLGSEVMLRVPRGDKAEVRDPHVL